jgi:hypothetical protein
MAAISGTMRADTMKVNTFTSVSMSVMIVPSNSYKFPHSRRALHFIIVAYAYVVPESVEFGRSRSFVLKPGLVPLVQYLSEFKLKAATNPSFGEYHGLKFLTMGMLPPGLVGATITP